MNKYTYYRVIQEQWGGQWCDVDFHECMASGGFYRHDQRALYRENLRAYRDNSPAPVRVIKRREINQQARGGGV
jgi:hypothetical protein